MSQARIFIVDDDQDYAHLLEISFTRHGIDVMRTPDVTCLPDIREMDPHVLLMDINMPYMSGDRLAGIVSRTPGLLEQTVTLLHSSLPEEELRQLTKSSGADGFISKRLELREVVRQVSEWIAVARSRRGGP